MLFRSNDNCSIKHSLRPIKDGCILRKDSLASALLVVADVWEASWPLEKERSLPDIPNANVRYGETNIITSDTGMVGLLWHIKANVTLYTFIEGLSVNRPVA